MRSRWCVFDHFEQAAPGRMSAAEFDEFVRDTVNFLDYVSEPDRAKRESLGLWVVLFLIVFTGSAWRSRKKSGSDALSAGLAHRDRRRMTVVSSRRAVMTLVLFGQRPQ